MAYISQEEKKELAPAIKAVAKKYGRKVTIGIRNHMDLVVKVKGAEDIYERFYAKTIEERMLAGRDRNGDSIQNDIDWDAPIDISSLSRMTYLDPELSKFGYSINTHWIEENYDEKDQAFLNELHASMHSKDFYNDDDVMTDYFSRSYYTSIELHK
jgi:alkanesulfonate monooxygenase SsuD/methylene tetrahydromethanopterin reductase-like flavin-dependent oxidoreductase (luciferase family)